MQVVWYTAMSMDGRIAVASIDAVVVGASTLRWLLRGGHGWPHDDLPTWLVSRDPALVGQVGSTRAPLRRVEGPLGPVFDERSSAPGTRASGSPAAATSLARRWPPTASTR